MDPQRFLLLKSEFNLCPAIDTNSKDACQPSSKFYVTFLQKQSVNSQSSILQIHISKVIMLYP